MKICPQCGSDDFGDLDIANPFDVPRLDQPGPHLVVQVCLDCEYCSDNTPAAPVAAQN